MRTLQRRLVRVAAAAVAVVGWGGILVAPTGASAAIVNGSFESGPSSLGPTHIVTLGAGDPSLSDWTIGGSSIDIVGTDFWSAQDGSRSIDLSGADAGSISQTVSTTSGTTYQVTFYLAGNPDQSTLKTLNVFVDAGLVGVFSFLNDSSTTRSEMGWVQESFVFAGTGTPFELKFLSTTNGPWGPVLDNVSISAIPLPAALPLFLSALAALAFISRRRRQADA